MNFLEKLRSASSASGTIVPAGEAVVPAAPKGSGEMLPVSSHAGRIPDHLEDAPAQLRAEARERRRFLVLVEMYDRQPDGKKRGARAAAALVAANHADEFPLLTGGGQQGKSQLTYSNYRNWKGILSNATPKGCKLTEEEEVRLLVKRYARGDRGSGADPEFIKLFMKMYLNRNCLSLPAAYRSACTAWAKEFPGRVPGTRAQCRLEIQRVPKEVVVRAREGETAWKNKCCDYISRDWTGIRCGEVAVGDSRTFDTRVKVWNEDRQVWESRRPTIAALLDARSWKFVSYWITVDAVNSDTLINTLALWIRNTGGIPPKTCYFDNGKDYNAAGFSVPLEVEGYQHSIFAELGIGLVNSIAYNGRAKTVERAFRDMMANFDKMFLDYLGSNPALRSDASSYYDHHPDELPSLSAFCKVFSAWLDQYHTTPKEGKIHGGQSPDAIWKSMAADISRRRTPEDLCLALLRPVGMRQVGRGGQIKVDERTYVTDDVRWGAKVLVKRSSFDDSYIMLYTADGQRLGIARSREAVQALAEGKDERQRLAEQIARQRAQDKFSRTMLKDLTGGVYGASPLEILLTAGTDAKFRAGGGMHLVKGGTHNFRVIEGGGMRSLEIAEVQEKPEVQQTSAEEEVTQENLQDLPRPARISEDENISGEELQEVYNFITNKNNQGEEDYDY